jgi:hypothetical protein
LEPLFPEETLLKSRFPVLALRTDVVSVRGYRFGQGDLLLVHQMNEIPFPSHVVCADHCKFVGGRRFGWD